MDDDHALPTDLAECQQLLSAAMQLSTGYVFGAFGKDAAYWNLFVAMFLFSVANGSAFWRKSSYLVGKEGEVVASPLVTVVDDPLIRRAPGSRPRRIARPSASVRSSMRFTTAASVSSSSCSRCRMRSCRSPWCSARRFSCFRCR